jgi:membrane-bound ClpP family serine protease
MEKRSWSGKVIVRYALLQLPGLAAAVGILFLVRHWMDFPDYFAWIAIGLWIAKDVVLFPFVWHAYDWDNPRHTRPMIGKRGQVREKLNPSGYVQVEGELWQAQIADSSEPVAEGEWVEVVDMDGLLLIVKSAERRA